MGTDTRWLCLSDQPQPLFNYFKQLFAQVTNPPIDPIREEMVMSLISYIAARATFSRKRRENCHMLKLEHPLLTNRGIGEAAARVDSRSARYHTACLVSGKRRGSWTEAGTR